MEFIEAAPIEAGFSQVFANEIAPSLDKLELQRQELEGKGTQQFRAALAIAALIGLAFVFFQGWPGLFFMALSLVFGFIVGSALRSNQGKKWSGAVAETVMPALCNFLGDTRYDRHATSSFSADRVRELNLVDSFSRATLEDHIAGTWQGVAYEMVEANLIRKSPKGRNSGSSETTVFKGLLFRISLPHPAPTRISILRNYGRTMNAVAGFLSFGKGRGMPRVETGHPAFEKDFELHAQHPDGVLDYLPPAFLDNLVAIGERESDNGTSGMRAAFDGPDFWLALERKKPFMEMARLNQPVQEISGELHQVFNDMALIRRIIDRLKG
jgi:hypothetical protein